MTPAQAVPLLMRHSPTGSDQGEQSQVLVTGSLKQTQARRSEKPGLGSIQGTWTVRNSRRQDWKQGYYGDPRSIQGAGLEAGLNTGTPMVSLGSAITGSWAHRQGGG